MIPTLELGIGFVPYSPLGRGFLTGKIDENANFDSSDFHSTLPRFTPEALKANQALINLLGSIAERKKATPAQIALAWLLAQKPWIVPIPGTTKLHRLEENIGAVSVELTPDDLRDIDTAASKITVQGARYPEKLEKMTRSRGLCWRRFGFRLTFTTNTIICWFAATCSSRISCEGRVAPSLRRWRKRSRFLRRCPVRRP